MAYTPDYSFAKKLQERIIGASFSVKMRGYAPEEVDDFLDELAEQLETVQAKLDELQHYEAWLRGGLHEQIVARAQQEAQNKANAMLRSIAEWNGRKVALEKEVEDLRNYVKNYRMQAARSLKEALSTLEWEQRKDNAEAVHYALPQAGEGRRYRKNRPAEEPAYVEPATEGRRQRPESQPEPAPAVYAAEQPTPAAAAYAAPEAPQPYPPEQPYVEQPQQPPLEEDYGTVDDIARIMEEIKRRAR